MSPWRNWLARSAVNRKDGGSSRPVDVVTCLYLLALGCCDVIDEYSQFHLQLNVCMGY